LPAFLLHVLEATPENLIQNNTMHHLLRGGSFTVSPSIFWGTTVRVVLMFQSTSLHPQSLAIGIPLKKTRPSLDYQFWGIKQYKDIGHFEGIFLLNMHCLGW